nr:EOG090X051L [Artemia franciscana]
MIFMTSAMTRFKRLKGIEPVLLVSASVAASIGALWLLDVIYQDEPLTSRTKRFIFTLVKKIPQVKAKIKEETMKAKESIEEEMNACCKELPQRLSLPEEGLGTEGAIAEATKYLKVIGYDWEKGCLSGTVYNHSEELSKLAEKVYGLSAYSNPLHPDVFPGLRNIEAEIVQMVARLFNGTNEACGTVTSCGTESLVLACKAFRDYAMHVKGIRRPEMVIPVTAHAGFDKAAELLRMGIKKVPVDPATMQCNMRAMRRAISRNTCMLVASAPTFPHGCIDPVQEIAQLGLKYDIPVHVDACLGGFLIPFMAQAGYDLKPFDFRVKGVTSISADPHKYGFTPKGASVLLFSHPKYRDEQFFVATDWPGGIYASPTIAGSRAGGPIATCWATMLRYGVNGYVESARKIVSQARRLEAAFRQIEGIHVLGVPEVSVVAIGSDVFDIYRLQSNLASKGFKFAPLQFPAAIHLALTHFHKSDEVIDRLIDVVRTEVKELLNDPDVPATGSAGIYGSSQKVPDRSIIGDIAKVYLNALYSIKEDKNEN